MALHGEGRHGKMRELYGMEVILTGDELFDTRIVLAGTQETKVRHALTPYICQRFLGLPLQVFMIDCRDHEVYCECTTGIRDPVRPLIPVVALLFDVIDRLV